MHTFPASFGWVCDRSTGVLHKIGSTRQNPNSRWEEAMLNYRQSLIVGAVFLFLRHSASFNQQYNVSADTNALVILVPSSGLWSSDAPWLQIRGRQLRFWIGLDRLNCPKAITGIQAPSSPSCLDSYPPASTPENSKISFQPLGWPLTIT